MDVIVVLKGDRFARNRAHASMYKQLLKGLGVRVVSITEPVEEGTPAAVILEGMNDVIAEWCSVDLSVKVSDAKRRRAEKGLWNGPVPFGYVVGDDGNLVISEDEAELVRQTYRNGELAVGTTHAVIREQVAAHQGFGVRSQGDGFMMAFSSARRALEWAIAVQQTLAARKAENPAEPISVRIGLHTGEAIQEGDDFFGKSVILAATTTSIAIDGQILVSSLLKALAESSAEFGFGSLGSRECTRSGTYLSNHRP